MFEKSYAKILEDLRNFEKLARSQTLTASLSKARSLTESSYELMKKLREQRPQLTGLLGRPTRQVFAVVRVYRDLQDAIDAIGTGQEQGGGSPWRGSQAILEDAERRGIELTPDLRGLVQGLDDFFDETDRIMQESADTLRHSQITARRSIETQLTTGHLFVALAIATSDYLCYFLSLQIYDQQDSEFEQTLRNEGIWDVLNFIIGAVPYVGLPASFVMTVKSLLERRSKRVSDADGLLLFLETYIALLEAWLPQADSQLQRGSGLIQERGLSR